MFWTLILSNVVIASKFTTIAYSVYSYQQFLFSAGAPGEVYQRHTSATGGGGQDSHGIQLKWMWRFKPLHHLAHYNNCIMPAFPSPPPPPLPIMVCTQLCCFRTV